MNSEYRGRNYKSRNYRKKRRRKLIITLAVLVVLVGAASAAAIVLGSRTDGNSDLAYAKDREESQTSASEPLTDEMTDIGIYETETATLMGEKNAESEEGAADQKTGSPEEPQKPENNSDAVSDQPLTDASDQTTGAPDQGGGTSDRNGESEKDRTSEKSGSSGSDGDSNQKDDSGEEQKESAIVPESDAVENSYFDDAVFIGDSRVDGFRIQSGLSNPEYLTAKGMNVKAIFTEKYIKKNGTKMTVLDALKKMEFNKVYIKLGINELGWKYPDIFIEDYAKLIGEIRKINPDAEIYVQSIIVVSKSKSDQDETYNNGNIETFNELLLQMAKDEQVGYLDLNEVLAGEDGNLPADASFDGVHLTPDYCRIWLDYLKNHVME